MCGIVGYVGSDEAVTFLTPALKRLEYRGYDSAGLATMNGHGLEVRKSLGKIAALERLITTERPHGRLGIAHTRWATHGRPSEVNAHPHLDCRSRVAVVHNGIIENHRAIRTELEAEGHRFLSDTDTEVIAHLIEQFGEQTLPEAVRRAVRELRGSFAIACIAEDAPDLIVAVRAGTSPLIVAWNRRESFLASDVPALIGRAGETTVLEDGDLAVLSPGVVEIGRLTGESVRRVGRPIAATAESVDRGSYPHFMLKEICEQPAVIARSWRDYVADDGRSMRPGGALLSDRALSVIERVTFLACGTSRHAGMIGQHLVEEWAQVPSETLIASECRHRLPIYDQRVLAVPISQSGETADTLAASRQAQEHGAATLAICNAPESSLARATSALIDTAAGLEIGVAATKSFTAQVWAATWLALRLAAAKKTLTRDHLRDVVQSLGRVPKLMEEMIGQSDRIRRLAEQFVDRRHCLYLGRGLQYPLALEGALKLKEISYIHAEGCAAGEMKHGPIALIEPGTLVVMLAPSGPTLDSMATSMQEVRARDGVVLAMTTRGDRTATELADMVIELPPAPAALLPLVAAVPLQLFAYHMAVLRGCDVDQPRNLAKSVTVE